MNARTDFDDLMRHLVMVGFIGLVMWATIAATGFIAGIVQIQPQASLRFLLAVLVLVFARRTYWELREWHARKLPPDARFGFANPLWEHPRVSELALQRTSADATGSAQTRE